MDISIVIPTYNESGLYDTVKRLMLQTVFKKYETEIILADYYDSINRNVMDAFLKLNNEKVKYVQIKRKGIAFARHEGIKNSTGAVIVNMDADAYFSSEDAIEKLVMPIFIDNYVITCCDNIFNSHELEEKDLNNDNLVLTLNVMKILCKLQKHMPIVLLEPGMTFSRTAYDMVGGFNDIKMYEGMMLSPRIIMQYGIGSKFHVDGISVIVSARRAIASSKFGLLAAYSNYDNAFRLENKKLNVV